MDEAGLLSQERHQQINIDCSSTTTHLDYTPRLHPYTFFNKSYPSHLPGPSPRCRTLCASSRGRADDQRSPPSSTGAVCHSHQGSSPKPRHSSGKHDEPSKKSSQTKHKSSKEKKAKKSAAEKEQEQADALAGVGSQFDQ